jgi:hypothetical protein
MGFQVYEPFFLSPHLAKFYLLLLSTILLSPFRGGDLTAKCPTCGKEVAPKKSWKMAGRPDKAGKRMELTIGLCECCGKTFRTTLNNQKI